MSRSGDRKNVRGDAGGPESGTPGYAEAFLQGSASARDAYGRFNLGIIGNTGVGKSSLVNAVFGRDHAKVGKGLPVTRGVHYYHDASLGIWDFEGFEIGSAQSPRDMLRENLATIARRPAEEQIAVVWYCVSAQADRLTEHDLTMIRELDASGLPVILVLTKVAWTRNPVTGKHRAPRDVEEFRDWCENPVDADGVPVDLPVQRVLLTAAQGKDGKGVGFGLSELVAETLSLAPDNEKDAFRVAQRLSLPMKRQMVRPVILTASAASATAAAAPIPFADAAVLAPIQMTMMGRISVIYDLELATMLSASTLAQLGTQITGRALARSFIKLIPAAGNVINGSIAFALTAATGEAWVRLCEALHTGKIDQSELGQVWRDFSPTVVNVVANLVKERGR